MGATLYYNGTIITLDTESKIASCMLIKDNKIQGVYDSPDECKGSDMRMVDLEGKTVIPGFNDNHIRLNFLGDSLESLHFHGRDEEEIVALLAEKFRKAKAARLFWGMTGITPRARIREKKCWIRHSPIIRLFSPNTAGITCGSIRRP